MLTFVAPAFREEYEPYMFIGSMLCQKNPDWKAIIYHNGPNTRLKYIVESFGDPRLIYMQSSVNTGAWGCYNRAEAINQADTDFIIQTSIQDYWLPNAVACIAELVKEHDFIYWNSINHLAGYENILNTEPRKDHIDWGNFAIKTSIARAVGIQHPEEFTGDGFFVEDCMKSGLVLNPVKIHKVLTIHN